MSHDELQVTFRDNMHAYGSGGVCVCVCLFVCVFTCVCAGARCLRSILTRLSTLQGSHPTHCGHSGRVRHTAQHMHAALVYLAMASTQTPWVCHCADSWDTRLCVRTCVCVCMQEGI